METFTTQAVYEKGVLKPRKKLNLPEYSIVEIRVRAIPPAKHKTQFALLIGMWESLPEKQKTSLENSLARTRQRSASKLNKIAKSLK
ncbi:MAG: antitoxin family protein [Chloroflexota bacterium]|nr:antitoxin family protein [Chloroflexota bacterium]MBI5702720.1 antitoxin family protein [Chloroflexota bacterium]